MVLVSSQIHFGISFLHGGNLIRKSDMTSGFDSQTLAEKLSKLNNSQQSIESLSSWCISHRKKARQVVETWEKLFNSSSKEQKVSFLYLANDILQNSRRKGSEFVNEFWKVLPGALKNVYKNGEDHGKNVVMRLVGIWDERKVFGSRGRGLKSDILGKEPDPPPLLDNNGKSSNSNSIKVVRKDAQTIRLKLAVGGMPEKIVTAYQSVLDEHLNEDTALNKCKVAIHLVGKIAQDVDVAFTQGNLQGPPLTSELHEHETILKRCIDQLKSVEASRASLIAYLKDGLEEQESKLDHIRTQMLAAERETDRLSNLTQRMGAAAATAVTIPSPNTTQNPSILMTMPVESMAHTTEAVPNTTQNGPPQLQHPQPVTSFTTSLSSTDEQQKKAAAAAMAAKLAASTSSAQMLTSVLSSLVAEEAASKNGSLTSVSIASSPPMFPANKRPKLEKPMPIPDPGNAYFAHMQQQQQQMGSLPLSMPPVSVSSLPPLPQNNHPLPPFPTPPPPLQQFPPPPGQQFMQTSGGLVGVMPYGYSGNPLPPPPLPSSMGLARPGTLPPPPPPLPPMPRPQQQPQQQPSQQQQQQQSPPSGFYQSPGNGFYGQLQSAPPGPGQ